MIQSVFPLLEIRGRKLLPIIQGGMGIGVSAHRLAGTVAKEGAIGTIASVELRRLHPDIMEQTGDSKDHEVLATSNLVALDREITSAREIAGPNGYIAINIMRAVRHYTDSVRQACKSGANAIIMGAGLPFDLPDLTKEHADVALIPILSEERGVRAVLKRWMRGGRLPDAIVIEHPRYAGGHLGAPRLEDVDDPKFDFARVLEAIGDVFKQLGLASDRIPLIPAGGINSFEKIKEVFAMGARGVQIGTPFAVTVEGDAHDTFKKVLATATPQDIVTFMSTAGLPCRAVLTPWLKRYLRNESSLRGKAVPGQGECARNLECLSHCGLKDGEPGAGQFCIETQLAASQKGDLRQGLFFRGSESLPFGNEIRPVYELLDYLLTGHTPKTLPVLVA
ncbi:nitronate monooxygenase [Gammaproteobacteria bacterium]